MLLRSLGHNTIQLLRDFADKFFITVSSESLELEDQRLEALDQETK
jgi:hypothetical protein